MARVFLELMAWALGGLVASFWLVAAISPPRIVEVVEWRDIACPQKVYGSVPVRDAKVCRVRREQR